MKQPLLYTPWFAAAAILVIVFGALYAVVQQAERTGANFPQAQIAEDVAAALDQGAKPESFAAGRVDMAASLAPFIVIYDHAGKVIAGSGYLGGQVPKAPLGMLTAARGADYNAVTWQPETGVRIASATVASRSYYVLSGRNLREVEKNENRTLLMSGAAGLASWLLLGVTFVLTKWSKRPTRK